MRGRAAALAFAVGLAACGGTDATCPRDMPATCPTPAPSYQDEIAPLFTKYCNGACHSPAGEVPDKPLETYDQVFSRRTTVLSFTYGCQMPPADFPQPTEPERVEILGWITCGLPDN